MMYNNYHNRIKGKIVHVDSEHQYGVEKALKKLKRKVQDSKILEELKMREQYEKPTTRRKRLKNLARRRWLKKLQDQALPKSNY